MKIVNHIIAVLLFLPQTISFIISLSFEILFNIFSGLHPNNFKQLDINKIFQEHNNISINEDYKKVIFIIKLLFIFIFPFISFFFRMKEIFEYDFMTKETDDHGNKIP